jgi:hypothetical protein
MGRFSDVTEKTKVEPSVARHIFEERRLVQESGVINNRRGLKRAGTPHGWEIIYRDLISLQSAEAPFQFPVVSSSSSPKMTMTSL